MLSREEASELEDHWAPINQPWEFITRKESKLGWEKAKKSKPEAVIEVDIRKSRRVKRKSRSQLRTPFTLLFEQLGAQIIIMLIFPSFIHCPSLCSRSYFFLRSPLLPHPSHSCVASIFLISPKDTEDAPESFPDAFGDSGDDAFDASLLNLKIERVVGISGRRTAEPHGL